MTPFPLSAHCFKTQRNKSYKMNDGWIKLYRSFLDWEWYTDANVMRVFLHLLLIANHEERRWMGIQIKRGQTVTSYDSLSSSLGLSIRQIRTVLSKLEKTGEICKKTTNKYTLITICNFDFYQSNEQVERQTSDKQVTSERQTSDNKQECKELKNISVCVTREENGKQLNELKADRQYQEVFAMQNNLTIAQVEQLIESFGQHLILGGDEAHKTKAEFISHFRDWARYRIEEQNKTYRQNGNKGDQYARRRGTPPSPLEEFINDEGF